jgi:hypothetical protein
MNVRYVSGKLLTARNDRRGKWTEDFEEEEEEEEVMGRREALAAAAPTVTGIGIGGPPDKG